MRGATSGPWPPSPRYVPPLISSRWVWPSGSPRVPCTCNAGKPGSPFQGATPPWWLAGSCPLDTVAKCPQGCGEHAGPGPPPGNSLGGARPYSSRGRSLSQHPHSSAISFPERWLSPALFLRFLFVLSLPREPSPGDLPALAPLRALPQRGLIVFQWSRERSRG